MDLNIYTYISSVCLTFAFLDTSQAYKNEASALLLSCSLLYSCLCFHLFYLLHLFTLTALLAVQLRQTNKPEAARKQDRHKEPRRKVGSRCFWLPVTCSHVHFNSSSGSLTSVCL